MKKKKEISYFDQEISTKPMIEAGKKLANLVFPTKESKAKKHLEGLEKKIELKKTEVEYLKKLKELQRLEEEIKDGEK